ncbi:hypothetical protein PsYK624_034900 [Phanerochaete sordida]|uniref:Uncharacterized protein n=1 Tax=Phanerochaete sordida TaxID=48140 RepID=A0A9P3G3G6_9APHY|nr:hypothetical protein PsYK624_034900 [Phanerochaete sordida]
MGATARKQLDLGPSLHRPSSAAIIELYTDTTIFSSSSCTLSRDGVLVAIRTPPAVVRRYLGRGTRRCHATPSYTSYTHRRCHVQDCCGAEK